MAGHIARLRTDPIVLLAARTAQCRWGPEASLLPAPQTGRRLGVAEHETNVIDRNQGRHGGRQWRLCVALLNAANLVQHNRAAPNDDEGADDEVPEDLENQRSEPVPNEAVQISVAGEHLEVLDESDTAGHDD